MVRDGLSFPVSCIHETGPHIKRASVVDPAFEYLAKVDRMLSIQCEADETNLSTVVWSLHCGRDLIRFEDLETAQHWGVLDGGIFR